MLLLGTFGLQGVLLLGTFGLQGVLLLGTFGLQGVLLLGTFRLSARFNHTVLTISIFCSITCVFFSNLMSHLPRSS